MSANKKLPTTRPLQPVDRHDLADVLGMIIRHVELLGWHVKQMRSGTAEEIDGGLERVKEAVASLRHDI